VTPNAVGRQPKKIPYGGYICGHGGSLVGH
jgi:hypothetical protein